MLWCARGEGLGILLAIADNDDAAEFTLCNQPPERELEVTARSVFLPYRRRDGNCCCYPSAAFRLKWTGQRFRGASTGYATTATRAAYFSSQIKTKLQFAKHFTFVHTSLAYSVHMCYTLQLPTQTQLSIMA